MHFGNQILGEVVAASDLAHFLLTSQGNDLVSEGFSLNQKRASAVMDVNESEVKNELEWKVVARKKEGEQNYQKHPAEPKSTCIAVN